MIKMYNHQEYMKKYRESHKEEIREYRKKYRAENKEQIKETQKKYMHKNYLTSKYKRDRLQAEWRKDNPERAKELYKRNAQKMRQKYPKRMLSRVKANRIKIPFMQD